MHMNWSFQFAFLLLCTFSCCLCCNNNRIPLFDDSNSRFLRCDQWNQICPTHAVCESPSDAIRQRLGLASDNTDLFCCLDPTTLQTLADKGQRTQPSNKRVHPGHFQSRQQQQQQFQEGRGQRNDRSDPQTNTRYEWMSYNSGAKEVDKLFPKIRVINAPAQYVTVSKIRVPNTRPPKSDPRDLPEPGPFPWGRVPPQPRTLRPTPSPRDIPTPRPFPWGTESVPRPRGEQQIQGKSGTTINSPPYRTKLGHENERIAEILRNSYLWSQLPPEWRNSNVKVVIVAGGDPKTTPATPIGHTRRPLPPTPKQPIFNLTPRPVFPAATLPPFKFTYSHNNNGRNGEYKIPQQPLITQIPKTTKQPTSATEEDADQLLPARPLSPTQKEQRPSVIPLVLGEAGAKEESGAYRWSGSATLIQDGGYYILVDTGSAAKRETLLKALRAQGVEPENVDILVFTHGHPDHIGNDNTFPRAEKMFGDSLYKGDEYLKPKQMEVAHQTRPVIQLTKNVEVWKTPGHTMEHNSVIVRNVAGLGNVAISGDLFIHAGDLSDASIWRDRSVDKEKQQRSREMILCQVDHILPGHGAMYRLGPQYKANVCPQNWKVLKQRIIYAYRHRNIRAGRTRPSP